ncbi:MAG TPA: cysteine dioxygenase family protein [Solirubrobacteraceae bacterium]|nr:cysteine dioxygenase family protein [Solirubrobacteraceae bacterium]
MSLTTAALERFVARLAATPELWQQSVRHASDARVYEQIWTDEDVNAWVICWSEDQDTGFHDHDDSSAAIAVIDGQVREDRLRLGDEPRTRIFGPGSIFTVPAVAIHRVLHAGDVPAVTLHAYSPPLDRTGAYRIGADGALERELLSTEEELRPTAAIG